MARLASTIEEKKSQIVLNYVFSGGRANDGSASTGQLPRATLLRHSSLMNRESSNEIRLIKFGSSF